MKPLLLIPVLLAVLTATTQTERSLPQQPAFRAGTQVVQVDVSVRMRNTPIGGLSARDFVVRDNGVVQSVELRPSDASPVDVSIVFGQGQATTQRFRLAADFPKIASWLRPADRIRVISFATEVREVLPFEESSQLNDEAFSQKALARAEKMLQSTEATGLDRRHDPALRRASLFDALFLALASPAQVGRRHLVVAFCYQLEDGSVVNDGKMLKSLAERADAALHVAFSTGKTAGVPNDSVQGQYTRLSLADAASATGGALYDASNGVGAFKEIFEEFRHSYLLTYSVTGTPTSGWHTISVELPGFPNYEIRARKGYMGR